MKRSFQLEGLRGIAVLLVFIFHAFKVPLFWSGVDLFFVLSGYLITGVLLRLKDARESEGYWGPFLKRRMLRILPPYLGFIAFLILFFNVPWAKLWPWYAFSAANLASTVGHAPVPREMVPLWSLAVEEQFYLIWPWIVLLCSRKALVRVSLLIVVAAPIARGLCTPLVPDHLYIYMLMPFRADLLAFGAFVAACGTESWVSENSRRAFLAMVACRCRPGLSGDRGACDAFLAFLRVTPSWNGGTGIDG